MMVQERKGKWKDERHDDIRGERKGRDRRE